jgi:hypothetical protein
MSLLTYSEKTNNRPLNWFEALSDPDISDERWQKLREFAGQWTTCACGNQCYILPRYSGGQPIDKILATLGGDEGFFGAVKDRDKDRAIYFLRLIENRSAELINSMLPEIRESLCQRVIDLEKQEKKSLADIVKRHADEKKALRLKIQNDNSKLKDEVKLFESKFGSL